MEVKKLTPAELRELLPLVWDVFLEYEGVQYPEDGKRAFWNAIHGPAYLSALRAYGAFDGGEALGVIAAHGGGRHVALFFVKDACHGRGIGRRLWNALLEDSAADTVTVHSSRFAVPVYEKLGFVLLGPECETDGIRYVPMRYARQAGQADAL